MITKNNFPKVLEKLGFSEDWKYKDFSVDFKKEILHYPKEIKIHGDFTKSFSQNENFVVFEAVFRLIEKGYKPEHIELEKKWKLGHGASGGRADILVKDEDGKSLLIIECKTWGDEFEKQKLKMYKDGGQLFSYWQQEGFVKFIVLYASTLEDEKLSYISAIVKTEDKKSLIQDYEDASERDKKKIRLYKNADNVVDKYLTWKKSYNLYFYYKGIFESDANAYDIEIKPLLKKDLKPIQNSDSQGLFNNFAEILRNNSVGQKERAFSVLVTMFLCKIVDETKTDENQQVKFQWLPNSDTDEILQDRLQSLYHKGMKDFLNQDTIYYSDKFIDDSCKYHKKEVGIDNLKMMLKELKFYKSNEFAFKKVYNEKLFNDNAKVVKEVVQLLETHKFVYGYKHKFLSNLFEKFLKNGMQQDEGQFFTPPPITKFITSSLPILRKKDVPKLIDYACGSGHFLIEAFDEVQKFSPNLEKGWERDYIFGIERDDSLVEISKVSAFLNGADNINIVYGNGLENYECQNITPNSFDLVLANPPYSIKRFKEPLLNEIHNTFKLMDSIPDNSNSIEVLFIERLEQLLKKGGVAGVILPSSILSNDGIYSKARAIILEYFRIVAIVEFGSNTFVATGTNTITLFLEKKGNFDYEHFKLRAEEIFYNKFNSKFEDRESLELYLNYRKIKFEDYKTLLEKEPNENMLKSEMFSEYLVKVKKAKDKQDFKKRYIENILKVESEKFTYFHTAKNEKVLIVKSGEKKVEKEFLGYEWSSRKGSEGLKEYKDENGKFATKLYDETNPENPDKVAFFVSQAFQNQIVENIPENLQNHLSYLNLVDMLDFSKNEFGREIRTNVDKMVEIESRWEIVKLGNVCNILIGGTPSRKEPKFFNGKNLWVSISEMKENLITDTKEKITDLGVQKSNVKLIPKNTTLLSFKLSIGKTAIAGTDLYTNEAIAGLIPKDKNQLLDKYIFAIFNARYIPLIKRGSNVFGKSLNTKFLNDEVKIPLPPKEVQEQIVSEIEIIDDEVSKAKDTISQAKNEIENIISSVGGEMVKLEDIVKLENGNRPKGGVSNISKGVLSLGGEHIHHTDGTINLTSPKFVPIEFFEESKKGKVKQNDILLCKDGALTGKIAFLNENITAMINEHIFIIRTENLILQKYIFQFLFSKNGQSLLKAEVTGTAQGGINSKKLLYIKIPLPSLSVQKEIVSQIEVFEETIKQAEKIISDSQKQKANILDKYLK